MALAAVDTGPEAGKRSASVRVNWGASAAVSATAALAFEALAPAAEWVTTTEGFIWAADAKSAGFRLTEGALFWPLAVLTLGVFVPGLWVLRLWVLGFWPMLLPGKGAGVEAGKGTDTGAADTAGVGVVMRGAALLEGAGKTAGAGAGKDGGAGKGAG